jgi:hypothetical protein
VTRAQAAYGPFRLDADWRTDSTLVRVSDGAVMRSLGARLTRRPSFSPDGAWIVAGELVVHLATDSCAALSGGPTVSHFLPDGRIVGARVDSRVVRLYCPIAP